MDCYKCRLCGYVYDPAIGDSQNDTPSGTKFEDLPESWHCPKCGGPKEYFGKRYTNMMPAGPLMVEHRLIEKVIELMKKEITKMKNGTPANPFFIEKIIDFIRTYADRCHHGKEEDILFRALEKKTLSDELKNTLKELLQEHAMGRETTRRLEDAKEKYRNGDPAAMDEIIRQMEFLATFYPKHIEKEDKHFFLPCMELFTQEEQDAMLQKFWDFDKQLIHEKYQKVYEELAKK